MNAPSVAIVGRANVGKSSLFNAICGRRVAIVDPTPGVTRDRIAQEVTTHGRTFELVDTGGVGMESADEIVADVEMQIQIAITQAALVLLIVDAQVGVQPLDHDIAQRLREARKEVIVVANKSERESDARAVVDFFALGFGEPIATAATHGQGVGTLAERIAAFIPEAVEAAPRPQSIKLAIVGRRNVGKSTLVNYLAKEPRMVVSELPGTTRDSVDVRFQIALDGKGELDFTAIDTAGMRKRRQISESVDFYSYVRTQQAIERADVVVHMVDAPGEISTVDKQLADHVTSNYKPCVLAVNKMDLVEPTESEFHEYARWNLPGIRFAPVVCISAKTGRNVFRLIELTRELYEQSLVRIGTGELNEALSKLTTRRRPHSKGARPGNVLYATQVSVAPPTIALFVNDSADVTEDYERYLANQLRREFAFSSVPIRFVVRRRGKPRGAPGMQPREDRGSQ